MSLIVNGRYIRNYGLMQAILRGYHTLLPINRFPLVVIQLSMHPSLIDVNVHPSKLEVRFSKEQELFAFVEEEVRKVLQQEILIPRPAKQNIGKSDNAYIQEQLSFPQAQGYVGAASGGHDRDLEIPGSGDRSAEGNEPLPTPHAAWPDKQSPAPSPSGTMRSYGDGAAETAAASQMRETAASSSYRSDYRNEARRCRNPCRNEGVAAGRFRAGSRNSAFS